MYFSGTSLTSPAGVTAITVPVKSTSSTTKPSLKKVVVSIPKVTATRTLKISAKPAAPSAQVSVNQVSETSNMVTVFKLFGVFCVAVIAVKVIKKI